MIFRLCFVCIFLLTITLPGVSMSPLPPVNVSFAPASAILSTNSKLTLAATYSDPDGTSNLSGCYLLINSSINGANAIYLCYSQNVNKLYLRNDANTSWGTGYAPGSSAVLENSQCKVYCAETTTASSGDQIQVNWKVEIKPSMTGKALKGWMLSIDDGGLRDGWDQMASYGISAPPQNISLAPSSGNLISGSTRTISGTYRDLNGYPNLEACYILMNSTLTGKYGTYLCYSQNTGKLYLRDDDNTTWGTGYAPGSSEVLENSWVKVYCQESIVTGSGTDLTINWSVYFKSPLLGRLWAGWMLVTDDQSLKDGWDRMATYKFTAIP